MRTRGWAAFVVLAGALAVTATPACKSKKKESAESAETTQTGDTESAVAPEAAEPVDPAALYSACLEALSKQDWKAYGDCYAEGATSTWLDSGDEPAKGRDAIVAARKQLATTFPDLAFTPELILTREGKLAATVLATGTHEGTLSTRAGEFEATGTTIGVELVTRLRIEDGKIAEETLVWDHNTVLAQIGVLEIPHRPARQRAEPLVVARAGDPDQENRAKETYLNMVEQFNKRDHDGMMESMAEDFVSHDPPMAKDRSREESAKDYHEMFEQFPDMKMEIDDTWVAGEYLAIEGSLAGTSGDSPIEISALEIARVRDGKLLGTWLTYDGLAISLQLAGSGGDE